MLIIFEIRNIYIYNQMNGKGFWYFDCKLLEWKVDIGIQISGIKF